MARVECLHYVRGECRSCGWIERDYADQLAAKQDACRSLLDTDQSIVWLPPQASPLSGFRNKAKLVVGGSIDAPTLGILDAEGAGVDLPDCRLYPAAIVEALPTLKAFIGRARIAPYRVAERRGELKYLLLTVDAPSGALMLRLVLRSREALGRIQREWPWLEAQLPGLTVGSVNLQPRHAAVLEGEEEILLTERALLPLQVNALQLMLQPGGFWQTNSEVAAALYREARSWTADLPVQRVLDLYCGIGGFAHHLVVPGRTVTGVELHPAAVASARTGSLDGQPSGADFHVADADALLQSDIGSVDLAVVNPPRRGLSEGLCASLAQAAPRWILYSSCNPDSLARDLGRLPGYRALRARLFDMFPHTPHAEVLLLLERTGHPQHVANPHATA